MDLYLYLSLNSLSKIAPKVKDVKQIQIPIPPEDEMNALKAILDVTKESLKKRREFEKAYHDANKAFLEYVYPDQH